MRRAFVTICLLFGLMVPLTVVHAASAFASPAFQQQWQSGEAITPNFWGPLAMARDGLQEPYKEATNGSRLVQYFDKARMELGANGIVTNGLLAKELVTGRMQTGNDSFQPIAAPNIEMAGDPGGGAPTYALLSTTAASLLTQTTAKIGQPMTATIIAGKVQVASGSSTSQGLTLTAFDAQTGHNILGAFAKYRDRVGLSTVGLAISEPWLSTFNVGGVSRNVAIEVFERRVLTYNPLNTPEYQVEMGNVGQNYFQWRYGNAPPPSAPAATAATTVATAAPAAVPPSPSANGQIWTDPNGRLSLRIPASWQINPSVATRSDDILGLSTLAGTSILSLSANPLDSFSLADDVQFATDAADQVLSGVQASSPQTITIGGEPAKFVAFAGYDRSTGKREGGVYAIVFHHGQQYAFLGLTSGDASVFGDAVGTIFASVIFLK